MSAGRWLGLEAELAYLERVDPVVRKSRERLDDLAEQEARRRRHLAARKAVGKRAMPKEEA